MESASSTKFSLSPTEHFRIITWPARDEDGELFFVVVGQSRRDVQRAQKQLILLLAIANPLALLLASWGGLCSPADVDPVDRLTAPPAYRPGNLSERSRSIGLKTKSAARRDLQPDDPAGSNKHSNANAASTADASHRAQKLRLPYFAAK